MTQDIIQLDHGSGGRISHAMYNDLILPLFNNEILARQDDGAVLETGAGRLSFSTDSYVVDPIFFPGGDIGDLAVNGTVNDIAMMGGIPLGISAGLIVEEGFAMADLEKVLKSMAAAARKAGVSIVTGDTKVVPRGKADKIFINTSGVGLIPEGVNLSGSLARPGDRILISGTIADHGITVLSCREGLEFNSDIQTDSAPLNAMVRALVESDIDLHLLRDPTRGGLGTTLNEIAGQSDVGIEIQEAALPMKGAVRGTCELLGFDPLYVANEGKLVAFVAPEDAPRALDIMKQDEFGSEACVIGDVVESDPGKVYLSTLVGGKRRVDMLAGEQLPRIC